MPSCILEMRGRAHRTLANWPVHDMVIVITKYYMAYIAKKRMVGCVNIVLRNRVGDEGGGGKQGGCLQIIVLMLVLRPRTKRMSCKGQLANPDPDGGAKG